MYEIKCHIYETALNKNKDDKNVIERNPFKYSSIYTKGMQQSKTFNISNNLWVTYEYIRILTSGSFNQSKQTEFRNGKD